LSGKYRVALGDILGEFRLLVAVSGILFGFLLNVSSSHLIGDPEEQMILMTALSFSSVSVVTFLFPVIYHHSHSFPLTDAEATKIYFRSHRFALWGLITLIITIYFSLILSLYSQLGQLSYILATIIMIVPAVLFLMRKVQVPSARHAKRKSPDVPP
jgi:hypothetical protein